MFAFSSPVSAGRRNGPNKYLFLAAIFSLGFAGAYYLANILISQKAIDAATTVSILPGNTVLQVRQLKAINGTQLLSDARPAIVLIFSQRCVFCQRAISTFWPKLVIQLKQAGIPCCAIASDHGAASERLLRANGIELPVASCRVIGNVPAVVIIDKDGIILARWAGVAASSATHGDEIIQKAIKVCAHHDNMEHKNGV